MNDAAASQAEKSGAHISRKAFLQAFVILLVLMVVAGILTRVIPAGKYDRVEVAGREVIDPNSFTYIEQPDYPAWRWFTAPLEVLFGPDGATVIAIILFILLVGVAFAILDRSGILKAAIPRLAQSFGGRKIPLLLAITFFFMSLGAFFGIFEEIIPLVPIVIALSFSLGWDSLLGLGMSVLATNVGFSTAIYNPFTIGLAQKLAGLPLFSGAGLRIILFILAYAILAAFLVRYARKLERDAGSSPVFAEDQAERIKYKTFDLTSAVPFDPRLRRAGIFLIVMFALILAVLVASPFVEILSDLALPLTGLLFVIAGVGSGLLTGIGRATWKAAWDGFVGIAPAVILLLMAASVKYIFATGGVLDTILYWASAAFSNLSPFAASLAIYALVLVLELFIPSGSAKALLVVPILVPLADLTRVSRQIAISAYAFGDGFSNLVYPTNAALLITLSLTVVSYPKWVKWLLPLWLWILLLTVGFLAVAVAINYGPF
jgi:uncharacterized ion transporter superfamily protein YfcC